MTLKAKLIFLREQAAKEEERKAFNDHDESQRSNVDEDLRFFKLPGADNWDGYTKAYCDEDVLKRRGLSPGNVERQEMHWEKLRDDEIKARTTKKTQASDLESHETLDLEKSNSYNVFNTISTMSSSSKNPFEMTGSENNDLEDYPRKITNILLSMF